MIVWCDLETTGLDPKKGSILEIALVATDDNFNQIGDPFTAVVRPLHLRGVEVSDNYVREMHTKSGLWSEIYMNDFIISAEGKILEHKVYFKDTAQRLGDVERAAIEWLMKIYWQDGGRSSDREPMVKWAKGIPLGGNTVHFDKRWLIEHMDELEALFSHRIYDVSTFTEEVKRAAPQTYARRPGLDATGKPVPQHRALDDIMNSIATARYYRRHANWTFTPDEVKTIPA